MTAARQDGKRRVSVNASPLQFRDHTFVEAVRAALAESGLDASRLEIEITENVLISDDQRALRVFRALKALGVQIALDDFGTGYSSLGYLSRLPFDTIKIDRSFVQNIATDDNSLSIVETIIRLGRSLDMTVVAEGVETEIELAALAKTGCDEIQGFVLGAAEPAESQLRQLIELSETMKKAG